MQQVLRKHMLLRDLLALLVVGLWRMAIVFLPHGSSLVGSTTAAALLRVRDYLPSTSSVKGSTHRFRFWVEPFLVSSNAVLRHYRTLVVGRFEYPQPRFSILPATDEHRAYAEAVADAFGAWRVLPAPPIVRPGAPTEPEGCMS